MANFSTENDTKLLEVENFLSSNSYLSGTDRPDANDARVFTGLNKKVPDFGKYPNLFAWYGWLNMFNPKFLEGLNKGAAKKQQTKKEEPKKKEEEVDDELFGDDDDDEHEKELAKKVAEKRKQDALAGKKAKVVIAKTIFIIDVKVFEQSQDLDKLAAKVFENIKPDGLVWNKEYKLEPIAFGMKKLRVGCVVEDDKIPSFEDIIELIQEFKHIGESGEEEDEVQSVDIASIHYWE